MRFETDNRVWTVITAISSQGKTYEFHTHFSLWEMAEGFYDRMSLLPHYSVAYPVELPR